MKKIVLLSTFADGAYAHILKKVMTEMGYMVIPFDHRTMATTKSPSYVNEAFQDVCKVYEPDFIFAVKGRGIYPSVIKEQSATTINWWLDNITRFTDFEDYADAYDRYWVCEASQGHPWMAIGIDPQIHCPQPYNDKHEMDILFAGTGHPKRTGTVESILQNMKPYNTGIIGNSWQHLGDKTLWKRSAVYYHELYKHYSGA